MSEARRQDRGFSRRPKILDYIGTGGLHEDDARQAAVDLVRAVREESGREVEAPAPDPEAVRERRKVLHGPDEDVSS